MTAHQLAEALVGARSRAMLSLVFAFKAKSFQSKSFRLPAAAESLSLCVAKEKVTKEKGHPDGAPCGHPALRVRGWATGFFDSTSCAGEKLAGIPAGHPAGFPPPTRRAIGAPVEQRASCAHSSEEPDQKQEQSHGKASLCSGSRSSFFSFITECGPGWPAALPGVPCAAVRRGRQAAQRANPWMDSPFRAGRMPARKARPRLTDLPGRMPGKRQAGCSFSLVTFSLSTQRESNSGAAGARKLFALNAARARASRTSALLQLRARQRSAAAAATQATGARP